MPLWSTLLIALIWNVISANGQSCLLSDSTGNILTNNIKASTVECSIRCVLHPGCAYVTTCQDSSIHESCTRYGRIPESSCGHSAYQILCTNFYKVISFTSGKGVLLLSGNTFKYKFTTSPQIKMNAS